ncbi:MAG: CPBP family intramembrane metalloprotease [SAR324 cluster bacterium]|nr:CPBP family intramembrane metalloprotease [SAR324 cluster bacterium]
MNFFPSTTSSILKLRFQTTLKAQPKLSKKLLLAATLLLCSTQNLLAIGGGGWSCFGWGALEVGAPGVGFIVTKQYEKAALLGGSRWIFMYEAEMARGKDDFQGDGSEYNFADSDQYLDQVSYEDSDSGKDELYFYYNKATWDNLFYGGLDNNFALIAMADLYRGGCKANGETAELMLSPVRFDHFLSNWMFYPPLLLWAYAAQTWNDTTKIEYHLGSGLSEATVFQDSMVTHYTVGIAEEMLFRGTIQHSLFDLYSKDWDMAPELSRHLSIFSSAAIFGLAHDGQGGAADVQGAFASGVYFGYVYHPKLGEHDLMTSIAIHSWNNMIITYLMLKNAKMTETQDEVSVPLLNIAFDF